MKFEIEDNVIIIRQISNSFTYLNNTEIKQKMADLFPLTTKQKEEMENGNRTFIKGVAITQGRMNKLGLIFTDDALKNGAPSFIKNPYLLDHKNDSTDVIGKVIHSAYVEGVGITYLASINNKHPTKIHETIQQGDVSNSSVGIRSNSITCSICKKELMDADCPHIPTHKYKGKMAMGVVNQLSGFENSLTPYPADDGAEFTVIGQSLGEQIEILKIKQQQNAENYINSKINKTVSEENRMVDNDTNPTSTEQVNLDTSMIEENKILKQSMKDLIAQNEQLSVQQKETAEFIAKIKTQKKTELVGKIINLTKGKPEDYVNFDIDTLEMLYTQTQSVLKSVNPTNPTEVRQPTHVGGFNTDISKETPTVIKQKIIDMFGLKDPQTGKRIVVPVEIKQKMKNWVETGTTMEVFNSSKNRYSEIFEGKEEKEDIMEMKVGN